MTSQQQSQQNQEPTEEEARITEVLAKDRPTIDAAVKSFMSLIVAKALTASSTDISATVASANSDHCHQQNNSVMLGIVKTAPITAVTNNNDGASSSSSPSTQALQLARTILKSVNSYTFPIHDTVAETLAERKGISTERRDELMELSVVAKLWNGLVSSNQKPSRFLGRRALQHAWTRMDVKSQITSPDLQQRAPAGDGKAGSGIESPLDQQQLMWLSEFERYLFANSKKLTTTTATAAATTDIVAVGFNNSSSPMYERDNDDSLLIWSADGGQAELGRRRQRRQDAATERGPSTPL